MDNIIKGLCSNCENNPAANCDTEHWCSDTEEWCEDCSEEWHAYNSVPCAGEQEKADDEPSGDEKMTPEDITDVTIKEETPNFLGVCLDKTEAPAGGAAGPAEQQQEPTIAGVYGDNFVLEVYRHQQEMRAEQDRRPEGWTAEQEQQLQPLRDTVLDQEKQIAYLKKEVSRVMKERNFLGDYEGGATTEEESEDESREEESSPESSQVTTVSNCDNCAVAVTTTGDHAFDDCWGFLANGGVLCNSCGHNCDGCDATTLKVDLKEGGDGWLCKACQEPEEEEETDEEYLPQECEAYLSRFSSDKKCDNVGSFAVWNEDEQEQANLHVCTHCYDHLCLKLEACEDEPTA